MPTDTPNMVMGADVHTCWEKFARYFEVQARVVPMEEGRYTIGAEQVEPLLDEHTIGVAGLLGTTFTGQMDDLGSIDALLTRVAAERGWHIPLHIDAASGGFIVPFARPDEEWDFRLPSVRSINVSNHKFGLVYPGMGTVIFRDRSDLPEELVFHINYLGGNMPNYSLNFSRPSTSVILQYFAFLRLGRRATARSCRPCSRTPRRSGPSSARSTACELLTDGSEFPIVALQAERPARSIDLTHLSQLLRERGWIVPAYTLPPNAEHITVLRMVIKENFSRDMVDMLAHDVGVAMKTLAPARVPTPRAPASTLLSAHSRSRLRLRSTNSTSADHDHHHDHDPARDVAQFVFTGAFLASLSAQRAKDRDRHAFGLQRAASIFGSSRLRIWRARGRRP